MSNKVQLAKTVTNIVVSLGTGTIVTAIVRNNTTPANPLERVTIPAGSFVLGGIVANAAKRHSENMIDSVVGALSNAKN